MSLVEINNLTFAYPGSMDNVFEEASFRFDTDWKLGLTGRNGRGKTTLLRLLTGEEKARSGCIRGVPPCIYFPFPVTNEVLPARDVISAVCPGAEMWQIERELSLIGLPEDILDRPFCSLSGGERTKGLLAALFVEDGLFPLIDEPTNHLDLDGRAAVAEYLRRKDGFILVSHDRAFLDSAVDHILAINRNTIDVAKGNFSTWFRGFEQKQETERQQNARLRSEIDRLEQAAGRAAGWSRRAEKGKRHLKDGQIDRGFVSHRAAKVSKRAKAMKARSDEAVAQKKALLQNEEQADDLRLPAIQHPQELLLRLTNIVPRYDGHAVCAPVDLELRRGERLCIAGPNGSGKSSILGVICGTVPSFAGELWRAPGLIVSSVPQDARSLSGTIEQYAAKTGVDRTMLQTIARKLGFERADFERDLSALSEGQKKKILLARSLCEPAHVYIWDEPLNYIDIYARMQIEQMLLDANAAMIIVEHDAAFRTAVAAGEIYLHSSPQIGTTRTL